MTDTLYVRGWDDCLRIVSKIFDKTSDFNDARRKIAELKAQVEQENFEKIRRELGAYGLF